MPGVEHRLLPESATQPRIRPTQLIFHSIVGSAEGAYNFFRRRSNLESTFIVKKSGHIIQIMDSERQADANFKANVRAGSIETEDDGDPNTDPWSRAQLNSLLRISRWYHERHGLPLRQCPAWDAAGYGYHRLFPNQWTVVPGKRCPGDVRVRQYRSVLLPAIVSGRFESTGGGPARGDDAQVLSAEAQRWLNQRFADINERIIDRTGAVYNLINAKTGLIPTAAADAEAAKEAAQQAAACCAALQARVTVLETEVERLQSSGGTQQPS